MKVKAYRTWIKQLATRALDDDIEDSEVERVVLTDAQRCNPRIVRDLWAAIVRGGFDMLRRELGVKQIGQWHKPAALLKIA